MGFGEAFNIPVEQMIKNVLKPSGITYEQIKKGPVCPVKGPWIPFKDGILTRHLTERQTSTANLGLGERFPACRDLSAGR